MDPTGPLALARIGLKALGLRTVLPWCCAPPALMAAGLALGQPLLAFAASGFAFGLAGALIARKAVHAGRFHVRLHQHLMGQAFWDTYVAAHHGFADLPEHQRMEATARLAGKAYERHFLWSADARLLQERIRAIGNSVPPGGVPVYLPIAGDVADALDRFLAQHGLPPLGAVDHHWSVPVDGQPSAHQRLAAAETWRAIAAPTSPDA